MNTNPKATTILCFGDSNTRGSRPDQDGRYVADVRWTGVLQAELGDGYYVIEEGRGGRTTDLDHPDAVGRNGRAYLEPCLSTHKPIDIVITMLGTNDLKQIFRRTPEDVARALSGLLDDIKVYATDNKKIAPRIIVVSPIHIAENIVETEDGERYGEPAYTKSLKLASVFKNVADVHNAEFFDAATVAGPGEDGVHIDIKGHKALGEALTKVVLSG